MPVLVPAIEAMLKEVKANGHLTYWIKKRVMRAAAAGAAAAAVEVEVHFRMRNVVPGSAAATRRTSSSSKSNSGALRPPDSDCHSIASTSLMSSVEGSCADDAISQAAAVSEGQNDEGETELNFDPLVWIANYLKEHNSHHQQHDHQPCDDNEPPATSSMPALLPDVVDDDTVASVDVIEGATGHVNKEPGMDHHGQQQQHLRQPPCSTMFIARASMATPAAAAPPPPPSPATTTSLRFSSPSLSHHRPQQQQQQSFRWNTGVLSAPPPSAPAINQRQSPSQRHTAVNTGGALRMDARPPQKLKGSSSSSPSASRVNNNNHHHRPPSAAGRSPTAGGPAAVPLRRNGTQTNPTIPLKRRRSQTIASPPLSDGVLSRKALRPTTTTPSVNLSHPIGLGTTRAGGLRGPLPPPRSLQHQHHRSHASSNKASIRVGQVPDGKGQCSGSRADGSSSTSFAPRYAPKGRHADKRSSGSLGVHTNECPVKHKWVDDGSSRSSAHTSSHQQGAAGGHEPAGPREGSSRRGQSGGQCPVCAALLEPHATRARENNLKLLTTALDVPPDARTITLRYGCRYGHKFTQSQNVSAPYDKPLSCPDCRLAKAPPPLRSAGIFRSKSGSRSGGTSSSSSRGPVDPLSGLTPRERQAAALKAARMEYQASLHKGVSLQHQTVETTAKVNQLVTRLKSQVPSTREQVVLGIVECPDELGLWPLLRSLLDLQPQPGQTEVDKDRLYRRAALLCHPDKCDHDRAKEAFAKLSAEYAATNNAANNNNNNPAAAKEILEDDEASAGRRIIIHVDVPSVMHRPSTCRDYTELMVNKWLASMAWGTVDSTTGQWILAASSTSINPPTMVNPSDDAQAEAAEAGGGVGRPQSVDGSSGDTNIIDTVLTTYLDYLNTKYEQGVAEAEDGEDGEEGGESKREDIVNELLLEFTSKKTSPGAKLRGEFEQIIKCLSLPPSVRKGFGLPNKVNVRQSDADSDNRGHTGVKGIFRHGLYSLLPSFINMIIDFADARRDFAIVLRGAITSDDDDPSILVTEDVASVVEELQLLCEGKHPAYCGKYKTKKIAI
ncbi:hypothetical protein FOZ63_031328, partial [Perkinsus olseni]